MKFRVVKSRATTVLLCMAMLVVTIDEPLAAEASAWVLERNDPTNEIDLFSRRNAQGYVEFLCVTRVRSRLSALVAVLRDWPRMPRWAYRTRRVQPVEVETAVPNQRLVYSVIDMPWPMVDRDVVIRTSYFQDPVTSAVTITGTAEPDLLALDSRYIRVSKLKSQWTFAPLYGDLVTVSFQGYVDVGGALSTPLLKWLAHDIVSEGPYRTVLGLRSIVSEQQYQQVQLPGVREPGR